MDLDKGTEHCVECGICIMNNDHHCPWTSKCVGKKNIKMFYIFVGSLATHIVYLVFALVSLAVFSENPRAKACYLKAGFTERETERQVFPYHDERWSRCHMDILRENWKQSACR